MPLRAITGLCLALLTMIGNPALAVDRPIRDDVFYFVLPDRFHNADPANDTGAIPGGKLEHGFDPGDKAFFHGGDLAGLTAKLDYLQGLGITAIWMGPIFKNKPVQSDANGISAGYHGYWTLDFTQIDPHFGSNEDLKTLVNEAHARGIKVFFDIIANHTADVIQYRQCHDPDYAGPDREGPRDQCVYRTIAEYPYTTVGGPEGEAINPGFQGDEVLTEENFAQLSDPRWAYTPFIPEAEQGIKVPQWLNDPLYYHNRGESTYSGENSQYGDFVSLDDLYTEHPRVVSGMVEIFKYWIREFRIDGFRVDTVKHVNIEFWQQFVPAIVDYAREQGIPEFFVFGEVYDATPEFLSIYTTEGRMPAVLDFGFQGAVANFVSQPVASDELRGFFAKDDYYIDADSDAYSLPTFIGNHDMGRIGYFLQQAAGDNPDPESLLKRARLGHGLMFFARGIPVIYYGDEQGFTGDGNDQDARENMFPAQVASYNDNNLIGTDATTATENFDTDHPLYRSIAEFSGIYQAHPTLRRGVQIHRHSGGEPGIYAFSRIDPETREEYILAFNNATEARSTEVVPYATGDFSPVYPPDGDALQAAPTLALTVPPLDFVMVRAESPIATATEAPDLDFVDLADGSVLVQDRFIGVALDQDRLAAVDFAVSVAGGEFEPLGRDSNPPYRVFFKVGDFPDGTPLVFRATVDDYAGHSRSIQRAARVDTRLPQVVVNYQNANARTSVYTIASTGALSMPKPLTDNRLAFRWPEGAEGLSLVFESREGDGFAFDQPVYLSLADTVMPLARVDGEELLAELSIPTAPALPSDPAPEPPLTDTVHIRGGMNAWTADDPLDYQGHYRYHRRLVLAADRIEFKFADATWQALNVGTPVGTHGASRGSNPGNLQIRIPEGQGGLYDVWFFAYPRDEGHYFFYRFEPAETPLARSIYLRGTLVGGWEVNETYGFAYQGEQRYTLETTLDGGENLEFKIADPDWRPGSNFGVSEGQTVQLDTPITLIDNGANARIELPAARYLFTLAVSDPANPQLTVTKTGEADTGPLGEVFLRGGMNDWSTAAPFQYLGENRYAVEAELAAGEVEFKIADADWATVNIGAAEGGDGSVSAGMDTTLARGENPGNLRLGVADGGVYRFELRVDDPAAPVLRVVGP